jgi:hypothetical protein
VKLFVLDNGRLDMDLAWMILNPKTGTVDNKHPQADWISIPTYTVLIVDLRRFRGLFKTENSARKGEHCHEQTHPTHRSFAEKLSDWLEPPMRSIPSPGSPGRSVSPMALFGAGSTKTRLTAASEKGSQQRRRRSCANSGVR